MGRVDRSAGQQRLRKLWNRMRSAFRDEPMPPYYSAKASYILVVATVAWIGAWVGVPYALGVTWPWRYGRATIPVGLLVLWIPLGYWLRRHGYETSEPPSAWPASRRGRLLWLALVFLLLLLLAVAIALLAQ